MCKDQVIQQQIVIARGKRVISLCAIGHLSNPAFFEKAAARAYEFADNVLNLIS